MDEERRGTDAVQRVRDNAKAAQARVHRLRKQMQQNILSSDDESEDGPGGDHRILNTQGTQADDQDSQLTRQQREDAEVHSTELSRPSKQAQEKSSKHKEKLDCL